ncbi:MAG: universal stress protein [Desulfobacterales bacterium]|nr:universal stress protein [Desulfobacterales bacterium]
MKTIDFKKVLCAVSLTELTEKVLPYASYVSKTFQSEIHLLYVVNLIRQDLYNVPGELIKISQQMSENAEIKLESLAEKYFSKNQVKIKTVIGEPPDEIIKYIEKESIDLVVMGTHGRRGIKKTFLGSVAEDVIKRSSVPVMTLNSLRAK